jgi:hypothetical protein
LSNLQSEFFSNLLTSYLRNALNRSGVIPGKLAVASLSAIQKFQKLLDAGPDIKFGAGFSPA